MSMFVVRDDPPPFYPGMLGVVLNRDGTLLEWQAVPRIGDKDCSGDTESDWREKLLEAAGIDPSLFESVDDGLVVHDLVIAVHGRLEDVDHPRQRLDCHLDTGAEPAWFGKKNSIDHAPMVGTDPRCT